MRHIFAFILLSLLTLAPAWSGEVGMVVKTPEDGDIMVNRGTEDSVRPGTHWYIYRDRKPIAELEVQLVDTYSSYTKVVSGGGVRVGDVVSDTKFETAPKPEDFAPVPKANTYAAPSPEQDARYSIFRGQSPETLESVNEKFRDMAAASTKSCEFTGGNKQARRTTANLPQIVNIATVLPSINYLNPLVLAQSAAAVIPHEISTNVGAKSFFKGCQIKVETTWWSEELTGAYADTIAFQEGKNTPQERVLMRSALIGQKGLDRYVVFHVKISNSGEGNVQIEPFHWHMFLVDSQGNRIKSERYDQILDKTLAPTQTIEGNVYFPRFDANGQDIVGDQGVLITFEDILSDRAEVRFDAPEKPRARNRF